MTLAVRVIPCLDVDNGRVVKGVNFQNLRDAGDPVEMAKLYDAEGADELTFLDITASSGDRETTYDVVRRTAEQVFIPLTVGGGVRTRRRRQAAAGRGRQGRRQHRRHRPPRAHPRDRRTLRAPGARALRRRPPHPRGHLRGDDARRPQGHRHRRRRVGAPGGRARRRRDPAQLDGRRRHEGRLRHRDDRGGTAHVTVPVIASGGAGGWRTSHRRSARAPTPYSPRPSSTSVTCGSPRSRALCARPDTPSADPGRGGRRSRRPAISPMSARRVGGQSGAVNEMTAPPTRCSPEGPRTTGPRLPR